MVDVAKLAPYAANILTDATIPELPAHYAGKVRDNYDLPDGRRILIATDRLSAFDRILTAIPLKGQVLTQTARQNVLALSSALRAVCIGPNCAQ